MHVSERNENDVTYGLISIRLKNRYSNLNDAENVLTELMQQLQPAFAIQHTTGMAIEKHGCHGKTTVVDYWQDADKKDWKVKGCTDGGTIAVRYIKNIGSAAVEREAFFLNGAVITGS